MEIIDLKKYLTPNEIEKQSNVITVSLYSDQIIERSGFYNTIFKRNVGQLRKRVFTISKTENVIEVITSLIPQIILDSEDTKDVEKWVDQKEQVEKIDNDIMLTWPSNEEKNLLLNNKNQSQLQVLLRKALFLNDKQKIIRYEETAMLPGNFSLQKR